MNEDRKTKIRDYKLQPTYYGVIQLTNTVTHKIYIDAVPNTKNRWGYYQTNLNNHAYGQTALQRDWDEYGADAFTYKVLWEEKTDDVANLRHAVKLLKEEWLERLQPFDDRGYNTRPKSH
ncbi:GIY-YIG nuclease family protein [Lacticaseibacillus yichunensis]|uniref:GIY-YIG nuclease family protein n=1 Tax=Lacticaseibacillus yichunensis TaxID=2486015 RepID=A0ABW4CPG2_9LACO|nr:GIY-YIG nuclease family protein [Lacticaseibacillus yichunensis]